MGLFPTNTNEFLTKGDIFLTSRMFGVQIGEESIFFSFILRDLLYGNGFAYPNELDGDRFFYSKDYIKDKE